MSQSIQLGVALAIGSVPVAIAGFAAMGAGLGVVDTGALPRCRLDTAVSASVGLATVSTIGWFGFLAGPPVIGFAASAVGLRAALGIVVARDARPRRPRRNAEPGRRKERVRAAVCRTSA